LRLLWILGWLAPAIACGSVASGNAAGPGPSTPLAALEPLATIDGAPLPPRAERTAVVFFASWCPHCRAHLGELESIAGGLGGLRVILVNAYEDFADRSDEARMRSFLAERAVTWPVVRDRGGLRAAFGGVPKIPAMFVFDAQGRELARYGVPARPVPRGAELRAALAGGRDDHGGPP
jgi:thiol-disulfide isomerase/thioredoxin